jgi:hypothetical protein
VLLADHHAELARAGGDGGCAEVWVGVAVARRVRGAQYVVGVEVRTELARRRRVEKLHVHAELALQRDAAPGHGQLVLGGDQDEIAVLAKIRIDAELGLELLVGDDAVRRELDAEPVRILMTDAAAGQRRGSRADRVALEHDDSAGAEARQMIGGAHAHDSRADDQDVGRRRHARHCKRLRSRARRRIVRRTVSLEGRHGPIDDQR